MKSILVRAFTILRGIVYSAGFVWLWAWIAVSVRRYDAKIPVALPDWLRPAGFGLALAGALLAGACIATFVTRGRGTPLPLDPPRVFVAIGPYRYVRNPMYVGAVMVIVGCGLIWSSPAIVLLGFAFLLIMHLLVVLYEERVLSDQFGDTYENYKSSVHRWMIRMERGERGSGHEAARAKRGRSARSESVRKPAVKRRLGVRWLFAVLAALVPALAHAAGPGAASEPEQVVVRSGTLRLQALLWRPEGRGPFPAVLFHHGSYGRSDRLGMDSTEALGAVFARHGYVFLFLFRRGIGLSEGQGVADGVLMDRAFRAHGQAGRNRVQLRLMDGDEMGDAAAGLAFLRGRPEVDPRRVALAGHSFGGSLAVLQTARDLGIPAAVIFSGSAYSWPLSPELRTRLLAAVRRTRAAIFFIHAANDYSITPGETLSAEMERLGKPHRLKIYPAVGRTAREGHNLVYSDVAAWEPDVFSFLNERGAPEAER